MLFDWLVVRQVVEVNPAAAVRGLKHVVKKGKTPVLEADEARALLDSIDVSTPIGLRDRALIALRGLRGPAVGILLFTGSPDAEGTLGGLVQQARRIEDHLAQALTGRFESVLERAS